MEHWAFNILLTPATECLGLFVCWGDHYSAGSDLKLDQQRWEWEIFSQSTLLSPKTQWVSMPNTKQSQANSQETQLLANCRWGIHIGWGTWWRSRLVLSPNQDPKIAIWPLTCSLQGQHDPMNRWRKQQNTNSELEVIPVQPGQKFTLPSFCLCRQFCLLRVPTND